MNDKERGKKQLANSSSGGTTRTARKTYIQLFILKKCSLYENKFYLGVTVVLTMLYVLHTCMEDGHDEQDEKPQERGHLSCQIGSTLGVISNDGIKL